MIKNWKQNVVTIPAGQRVPFRPTISPNVVQVINRTASGGGTVYADDPTNPNVSSTFYSVKIEQGNTGAIVRPYVLNTVYLASDAAQDLQVTIIEIESDDLSFVFNASQVLQIQGSVQVAQPVQISGTVEVDNASGGALTTNAIGSDSGKSATAAANTQVVLSIAGVAGKSVILRSLFLGYSGANPAAPVQATVSDGTTTLYFAVGSNGLAHSFTKGAAFALGATLTITLPAGGAAAIGAATAEYEVI